MADPVLEPPVYESTESWGMQRWFQAIHSFIKRRSRVVNKTTTYTFEDDVFHVRADATGGAFSVTVPAALGRGGRQVLITRINSGVNAVTVARTGTDTFEGATTISLAAQWNKALLISNDNDGWDRLI